MHQEACKSSRIDVGVQLINNHAIEIRNNGMMFLRLLGCIHYLARQGLAFRGHS